MAKGKESREHGDHTLDPKTSARKFIDQSLMSMRQEGQFPQERAADIFACCYGLNDGVPSKLICWNVIPNVQALRSEAFWQD
jgi:hypothetical protein